jgi:hypothetical protein
MHEPTTANGVTRRSLLQTGGGAMLVALVGGGPWSVAKALAADAVPAHLRRSTYLPLVGSTFTAGSHALRLEAVTGDREDVFGLTFTGAPLEQGIHELRHSQLGAFSLFVAPVGAARDQQAVIDRSVTLPQAAPAPTAPATQGTVPPVAGATEGTVPPVAGATAGTVPPVARHRPMLRHARMRRAGHGLRCEVALRHAVKRVELRLLRGGRTVAKGHRKLRGARAAVRMATRHRLPAGEYQLLVVTTDLKGRVTSQATTVRIP